ncbi:hypothetical protein E3P89_03162 [Wallemia ichthyophaga]|uniref:FAS1 domain-containing protein n=1 Tax=Wallemia ichthyophaga TaxID=245174 RepID=A0A4T0HZF0_WALIC|nr:hypothetical protein E3P95_03156 [Wallemia ichthyophaga]TIA97989.1 hypothetical protein E3P94_03116 [Wallemia ichthyophaga]TIB09540.1 hypothetical protein E3P93_03152 [Wallemia ichthyophaga]TIB09673.1 hypothetical protein E3P90_03183 [Wallemia ichthyophaga]TIB20491.1 hypothetical protein E3P89_03162 [Wallemia ichthyophaga]
MSSMTSLEHVFTSARVHAAVDAESKHVYFDERLGVVVRLLLGEVDECRVWELLSHLHLTVHLSYVDSQPDDTDTPPILVSSIQSTAAWGLQRENGAAGEKACWIATSVVHVDAVRVRMNISNPLAALTCNITYMRSHRDVAGAHADADDNTNTPTRKTPDKDSELLESWDSWDSINLLEDIAPDMPQKHQNIDIPQDTQDTQNTLHSLSLSDTTYIPISSALSVRMRAVNIPFLLDSHQPHLALGLEVENCTARALFIHDADVRLKEASVENNVELVARRHDLSGAQGNDNGDGHAHGDSAIPIQLLASEQVNLIYVVVFQPTQEVSNSHQPHRPRSSHRSLAKQRKFNVHICIRTSTRTQSCSPTNTLTDPVLEMKWNSVIDISNALIDKRPWGSSALISSGSESAPRLVPQAPPVAGNKKYAFSSLQRSAEQAAAKDRRGNSHARLVHSESESDSDSDSEGEAELPDSTAATSSKETVLLSVSVLKPTRSARADQRSPSIMSPGIRTSLTRTHTHAIKPLDIFPVEVFLFNDSTIARRFVVNFASHTQSQMGLRSQRLSLEERLLGENENEKEAESGAASESTRVGVLPLENLVRIGPLLPGSCQSVHVNFLALAKGTHAIDKLDLYDPDTGFSSRQNNVASIVVSIAILSAAASAATALHLPVSIFSEEAALQRQFVDTSKGWLNEFLGNNGETIDNLAGSSEVTDNAWDILKGDPKKFSKFTTILEKFSPTAIDHIKDEKDFTLFVPTNDAIPDHKHKHNDHDKNAYLNADIWEDPVPSVLGKLYAMADKVDMTQEDDECKRRLKKFIEAVVMYHTVAQKLDVNTLHDFSTIETILKEPNTFNGAGQRLRVEQQYVPPATVINHYAKISTQNIQSANAVIHALDHVLIPPPSAINALFIFAREFSIFTSALQKVGLAEELDLSLDGKTGNGQLTINAPLNSAFERLPPKVLGFFFSPMGSRALRHLLEYHIVPNNAIFVDFQSGEQAKSVKSDNDDLFHKKIKASTMLEDGGEVEYDLIKSQTVPYGPYTFDVKLQGKSVSWHDGISRNAAFQVLEELLMPPKHDHNGINEADVDDEWAWIQSL